VPEKVLLKQTLEKRAASGPAPRSSAFSNDRVQLTVSDTVGGEGRVSDLKWVSC
jgi:hypothetical protein